MLQDFIDLSVLKDAQLGFFSQSVKTKKFLTSGEKDNSMQHYLGCKKWQNIVQTVLEMAYNRFNSNRPS